MFMVAGLPLVVAGAARSAPRDEKVAGLSHADFNFHIAHA